MIQIDTDADVDALCEFLCDDNSAEALEAAEHAQQHVFHLLHKSAENLIGSQCKGRLSMILEACSRCCTTPDRPVLHHTLCIAALQEGRLDEALQAVATLQEETRDSSMHEIEDGEDATQDACAAGDGERKSQHLSACLLRLKIETMVSFLCSAAAPLDSLRRCASGFVV